MDDNGMVAIVQGLEDSRLAVTLVNKQQYLNSIGQSQDKRTPAALTQASQATLQPEGARQLPSDSHHTTAPPVHNGHYASSYQVAHCNVQPTTAPEQHTEFPPQRTDRKPNEDNFQVGTLPISGNLGNYSKEHSRMQNQATYYVQTPNNNVSAIEAPNGRQSTLNNQTRTSPDGRQSPIRRTSPAGRIPPNSRLCPAVRSSSTGRSSPTGRRSAGSSPPPVYKDSDLFAKSLRRYPPSPSSPERLASSDLVNKLLSYTQNKLSSSNSGRKSRSPSASPPRDSLTKTIQSYTRAKPGPKHTDANNKLKQNNGSKAVNTTLSPMRMRNTGFDYLKASQRAGNTEVRYLDDLRDCIRDTLNQIYSEKTGVSPPKDRNVCSNMANRYSRHRSRYHRDCKGPVADGNRTLRKCNVPELDRTCDQVPSCSYRKYQWTSPWPKPTLWRTPCVCKTNSNSTLQTKITEEILKWQKELPIYAHEPCTYKLKREKLIRDLINNIKSILDDPDFESKARMFIKECVDELPIWYPDSAKERDLFKQQIINDLVDKLTNVMDNMEHIVTRFINDLQFTDDVDKGMIVDNFVKRLEPLAHKPSIMKSVIQDMLQDLPMRNKDKTLEEKADILLNALGGVSANMKLEKAIRKWLESRPELSSIKEANTINAKDLAKRINTILKKHLDDSQYMNLLRKEIVDWIENLEAMSKLEQQLDSKTKANMADELCNILKAPEEFGPKYKKSNISGGVNDYENFVWEWLAKYIPTHVNNKKLYPDAVRKLARRLCILHVNGAPDYLITNAITKFLDNLIENGESVSDKDKLAELFFRQFKIQFPPNSATQENNSQGEVKEPNVSERKPSANNEYENLIWQALDNNANIPEAKKKKYAGQVKDLANKLEQLKKSGANDKEIANEIKKFLEDLSDQGEIISNSNKLLRDLVGDIRESDQKPAANKQYEDLIWQALDNNADIPEAEKKKYAGQVKDLASKIEELKKSGANEKEIANEIKKFLEDLSDQGETISNSNKLLRDLVRDIKQSDQKPAANKQYEDLIWQALDNNADIPDAKKKKYAGQVKELANKIEELKKSGANEKEIANEIKKLLEDLSDQGETISNSNKLVRDLVGDIKESDQKPAANKQYEDLIWQALDNNADIPDAKKKKYAGQVKELANKIEELKNMGANQNEIANEIKKLLEDLSDQGETISNSNKLVRDLVADIKESDRKPAANKQYEDLIWQALDNNADIPDARKKKYAGQVKELANKIEELNNMGANQNEIANEIKKLLEDLSDQGETISNSNKLVRDLVADIKESDRKPAANKQYEDLIWQALDNNADIPDARKKKYAGQVKELANKIEELNNMGANQNEIANEIKKLLEDLSDQGETISNSNKLVRDLVGDIKQSDQKPAANKQYEDLIWQALDNNADIPDARKKKYAGQVKELANKIEELNNMGANQNEIANEIKKLLEDLSDQGETISNSNKLVRDLVGDIKQSDQKPAANKQYEDLIWQALDNNADIPDARKKKYAGQVKELANKIEELNNMGANQNEIANEIKKLLEDLSDQGETISNSNKLARDLVEDIKQSDQKPAANKQYEDLIWQALDNNADIPDARKKKYAGQVKELANKIEELNNMGANQNEIANEIKKLLEDLSDQGETISNSNKLVRDLVGDIKQSDQKPAANKQYEDLIWQALDNNADIPDARKKKYAGQVKELANKIEELNNMGANQNEIANEIKKLLEDLSDQGETISNSNKLVRDLVGDIKQSDQKPAANKQYEDLIWQALDNNADIPDARKKKYAGQVKELANKIEELNNMGANQNEIANEIKKLLEDLSDQGETISNSNKLARDLVEDIKQSDQKPAANKQYEDLIWQALDNNADIPDAKKKKYAGQVKDLASKIEELQNIGANQNEIANEIKKLLEDLSDQGETIGNGNKLVRDLVADIKESDRKPAANNQCEDLIWQALDNNADVPDAKKKKYAGQIKELANKIEELKNIGANRNRIANEIKNFLEDLSDQGESINNSNILTRDLIEDLEASVRKPPANKEYNDLIWQALDNNADIPEEKKKTYADQVRDLANKLEELKKSGANEKEIATETKNFLEDLLNQEKTVSPKTKKDFPNFMENMNPKLKEILERTLEQTLYDPKTAARLSDIVKILQDFGANPQEARSMAEKLMETKDRNTNVSNNEATPSSYTSRDTPLAASTPVPRSAGGPVDRVLSFENSQAQNEAENNYFKKLTDILSLWIEGLRLKNMDENMKEGLARNLASEIIDRQKYLQLNPYAKISDEEELEQLKYQVFKRLNKILDEDDLAKALTNARHLINEVCKVKAPDFVKTKGKQSGIDESNQIDVFIMQNSSQFVEENLTGAIKDWLNSIPLFQKRNTNEKLELENVISRLSLAIKSVIDSASPAENVDSLFVQQIIKQLKNSPIDANLKSDSKFLENAAESLLQALKECQFFQDISDRQTIATDRLQACLDKWLGDLPVKKLNNNDEKAFESMKKEFASILKKTRNTYPKDDKKLKDLIFQNLIKFPIDETRKNNKNFIRDKVEGLFKDLLIIPIDHDYDTVIGSGKKASENLFDEIEEWCYSFPYQISNLQSPAKAKKDLASKLISKIGKLNMNSAILHDAFLYEQIFEDELDNLLTDLSRGDDKNNLPALKKDLVDKVKAARMKTLEEIAGQTYLVQLRDKITKSFPCQTLRDEENAAFLLFKDNLINDFICLHFVGEDEELKKKYKTKFKNLVNEFNDIYFKNCECKTFNDRRLDEKLFKALKTVPVPKDEALINEVELAKIKEELDEWVKQLPLKIQSAANQLQINKVLGLLAKNIQEIEKQKRLEPNKEAIKTAALKFIHKLLENLDENTKIIQADYLVKILNDTLVTRRVSSSMRTNIDVKLSDGKITCHERCNPQPVEKGSQTRILCPAGQNNMLEVGSQADITPHLIVKEYYWDPTAQQYASLSPPLPQMSSLLQVSPPCAQSSPYSQLSSMISRGPLNSQFGPCSQNNQLAGNPRHLISSMLPPSVSSGPCKNNPPSMYNGPCSDRSPTCLKPGVSHSQPTNVQLSPEASLRTCYSPRKSRSPIRSVSALRHPLGHELYSQCPFDSTPMSSAQGTDTPLCQGVRQEWDSHREASSEEMAGNPCRSCYPRSVRLGSFDDIPSNRSCLRRSEPHDCSRSRRNDGFAGGRRAKADPSFVRLPCRGRIREQRDDIKSCAKCCGPHCPFPSYIYFR